MDNEIYTKYYNSKIGLIKISANKNGIAGLVFSDELEQSNDNFEILEKAINEIDEYFIGIRKNFTFKLDLQGTDFQKKVWNSLLTIKYGETKTYKDIANIINNPDSMRAIGNANHVNKIAIIIPCHRVIGVNGKLVGYAGGLWRKEWLINHEKQFNF
jgi:methylated-DNA-[protein]-cysteine S-methyltransferase